MPWTAYLANKYLSLAFRGVAYSRPSTLYFGLFTSMPGAGTGSGITGTEVSGNAYTRVAVAANTSTNKFAVTVGGSANAAEGEGLLNNGAIIWTRPTGAWGEVVAYGIFDAASGGNLLWYEALSAELTVDSYGRPYIASGQMQMRIEGGCGQLFEKQILNHLFRGVAWVPFSPRLMLGTGAGTTSAFASEVPVSSDGDVTPNPTTSYSRPALAVGTGSWDAAAEGQIQNTSSINFTFGTAYAGGTVTHWGIIHDAASTFNDTPAAGNMIWHGSLTSSLVIGANSGSVSTFTFAAGDCKVAFQL